MKNKKILNTNETRFIESNLKIKERIKYLSVHDASPRYQKELEKLFHKLKHLRIKNKSIAIVPNWDYKWDIRKYPKFINLMKEKEKEGWELVLHGYSHSHPKHTPWYNVFFGINEGWEFYKLNYQEAKDLIINGLKIFEDAFGHKPKGFIAPNWRLSKEGYLAVKDLGFEYTTSIRKITRFKGITEKYAAIWNSKETKIISSIFYKYVLMSKRKFRLIIHPKDILGEINDKKN